MCWLLPVIHSAAADKPAIMDDFELRDHRGALRKLSDWRDRKAVVVAFLGADCPLSKIYGMRLGELARGFEPRGVAFVGVDSNQQDSMKAIGRFAKQHGIGFPVLKDVGNAVADRFGAQRTPEVFVLDAQRTIQYRGLIDDQYDVGVTHTKPGRRDLTVALEEILAGKPVSRPVTKAVGCYIGRVERGGPLPNGRGSEGRGPGERTVTYTRDIAPILQKRCQVCHRPGQVAPFALTSYEDTAGWAETIREVLQEERMPPWHANPKYGRFANDPRPADREKQLIYDWIDGGCAEGSAADLPPPALFNDDWHIPTPDLVIPIPKPFTVPAEGVIEYQIYEVDPGFKETKWIKAAEIRPSNRAVVHHATIFVQPPGYDELVEHGVFGANAFLATAPGTPPMVLPDGMAKMVPAGWHMVFVIHYVAIGSVQSDQTSIGLVFADPATVKKEVATKLLGDDDLSIPPRTPDHRVEKTWRAEHDVMLFAMFPHMHLRGRSFRYEAVYPSGASEILLDVPRYDFNWQNRYVLAEPKRLPAGTEIHCIAHYDNSANNPSNPNPDATVRAGKQTWDEMFNGYFDIALADQDRTRSRRPFFIASGGLIAGMVLFLVHRRRVRSLQRP